MSNPPKIVVEIPDSRLKVLEEIPSTGSLLKRVRTGQYQTKPTGVSRIVLELSQKAAYDITAKGNEIIVVVGGKLFKSKFPVKDAPAEEQKPDLLGDEKQAKETASVPIVIPPNEPARTEPSTPSLSRKTRPVYSRSIIENLSKDPISFEYKDADIREVISMLASKINVNIIYSEDISGNITISLARVPFDEAFKTVLNVKGYATQQVGDNILRIASPQTFVAEQKKAMPQTRVFFLSYIKTADAKAQVESVSSAEGRKAVCSIDDNSNALIVTDTPLGLEQTARFIKSVDRPPKQVLIEAKLVEVALDSGFHFGIQWSGYTQKDGAYVGAGDTANMLGLTSSGLQSPYKSDTIPAPTVSVPTPKGISGGTGVSLPANVIYGAFRLGKIAGNYMIDSAISMAASKGKAKVLSDPKVTALNNKESTINITSQIPYTTTETTQTNPPVSTTKVTYITTGIVLRVMPIINSDGRITLKINPSVSQQSPTIPATAGGAPGIDTRSVDTTVIAKDGETIVIGGLINDTQIEGIYKIPLLGDIPLLGWLFKKKSSTRDRRELLIFVTPRIIEI
ncbi:MAG: type IV pilus secretin PilQ [Elusimicrobia bacterium]|nr:type IV pilus secretin PilQ [Elusimicrobiota bacterium]